MTNLEDERAGQRIDRRSYLLGAAALLASTGGGEAGGFPVTAPAERDPLAPASVRSEGMREWFDAVPGERMRVPVGASETSGALSVLESVVSPAAATPLHYHAETEVFLVLSGTLRIVCGGKGQDVPAGASAVVPAGAHHGFVNLSGAPVRFLAIFAPGGIEALFAQLAGTPPHQWSDLARRFGTTIVGPPVTG